MTLDLDKALILAVALPGALLLLKLVLGVSASLKDGSFDVRKLPGFLQKDVLPFMLPLVAMGGLSVVFPEIKALYIGSSAAYVLKLIADMKDTIAKFYGVSGQ
jgi:hypothetical protein